MRRCRGWALLLCMGFLVVACGDDEDDASETTAAPAAETTAAAEAETSASEPASSEAATSEAATSEAATSEAATSEAEPSGEPVEITWWHNANTEPGRSYWQKVADDYTAAHPNVTVEVVPIQNEELRTKIAVALQGDDPPDLFQQWGGGQMTDQVNAGKVMDITEAVAPWIDSIGGAASGWQVDGKQYGVPYTLGIVGFWYNEDHFAQAGIAAPPTTFDELLDAVEKLKAAGITPIAIGAKDRWPAAFYWDYFAVRMCSQATLEQAAVDYNFDDPCWVQAGEQNQRLIDAEPFQRGFLGTPAQQGAASSAGLIGNGKAAMELMGHWNPSVMNGLTPDKKGLGDKLGWFPFPAVDGGAGDPSAALGGGDGFSCSSEAPPECVDFLAYIVSPEVQTEWAKLDVGPPVTAGSESAVDDPNLLTVLEGRSAAPYVQTYLDIAYTTNVGQALNDAVAEQFAESMSAEEVVEAIKDAAANR